MINKKDLEAAIQCHREGNLKLAEQLYLQLLQQDSNNSELLHLLAIFYSQQGDFKQAIYFIQQAIKYEPNSAPLLNTFGNIENKQGNTQKAIKYYTQALQLTPNYAVAHNSLGNIYLRLNQLDEATKHYKAAIAAQPDYTDAHYNLAIVLTRQNNLKQAAQQLDIALRIEPEHFPSLHKKAEILQQLGKLEEAIELYKTCIHFGPDNPEILYNLGVIYLRLLNPTAALKYFLRAMQLKPDIDTYYNLGVIYMYEERHDDAIKHFRHALAIDKNNANAFAIHNNLGAIYLKRREHPKAIMEYQIALQLQPNNTEVSYILTALTGNTPPKNPPPEYIASLFDQYAPYFEQHLVDILGYNVPQILHKAVSDELNSTRKLKILDLGCGTGLCGEEFRQYKNYLIGIDLSQQMLNIARKKGVYDELECIDIIGALQKYPELDLIIAGDALVYCGDLADIFALSNKTLTSHGLFAFTIEASYKYPYELTTSARYAHSKNYIEELATSNNFEILRCDSIPLNRQRNQTTQGYLFVLINNSQDPGSSLDSATT